MKWQGKKKAVTFSFDDGVTQDIRLVELFNRYGLKGTFNINSDRLGVSGSLDRNGHIVRHDKIAPKMVKELYQGYEVAVHTLTHPDLRKLSDEEVVRQVEEDRKNLSALVGYDVVGMAYPFGTFDDRVVDLIEKHTGVKYSRTVISTHGFVPQKDDLLRLKASVYYIEDCLEEVVDEFLNADDSEERLLYIWGHSYEMDAEYITWEKFESICKKLSGRSDIFYGTNAEVLL